MLSREQVEKKLQGVKLHGMQYRKRRALFVNYKESCAFNPLTGNGHSYRWYELTKVINGTLVLNTYHYSSQTSKHIGHVRGVLKALGLKYATIQAPRGLQDLNRAVEYAIERQAEMLVKAKYGRDAKTYEGYAKGWAAEAVTARLFGGKTRLTLKRAIELAEEQRRQRLDGAKVRAERQRRNALERLASSGDLRAVVQLANENQKAA